MQIMVVFLHTSNEQTRKEKRKIILFKMTYKRIKYSGLNIYREVKYLYSETQSCPTLCDVIDCDPPGSSVHGILQARVLEWVAMPSRGSSQTRD